MYINIKRKVACTKASIYNMTCINVKIGRMILIRVLGKSLKKIKILKVNKFKLNIYMMYMYNKYFIALKIPLILKKKSTTRTTITVNNKIFKFLKYHKQIYRMQKQSKHFFITQTRPCNILQYFTAVKMIIFR